MSSLYSVVSLRVWYPCCIMFRNGDFCIGGNANQLGLKIRFQYYSTKPIVEGSPNQKQDPGKETAPNRSSEEYDFFEISCMH